MLRSLYRVTILLKSRVTYTYQSQFASMSEASWTRVQARPDLPSHQLFMRPIRKNDVDKRDYRLIKLENGLQALLIHDPTADKAAAAMDVGVGHLADPVGTNGICISFFVLTRS